MKETTKLIISILCFAGIFLVAAAGYNYLSEKYKPAPALPGAVTNNSAGTAEAGNTEKDENSEASENVQPAPDFTVYSRDGGKVTLSEKKGKPVIINFWATWCGPCKLEMPHFQKAYEEFGDRIEFMMINPTDGINDTQESVARFLEETGYTFPVYCDTDSDAGTAYGITGFPTTFFVDSEGNLLGYYPGTMDEATLYACIDIVINNEMGENQ